MLKNPLKFTRRHYDRVLWNPEMTFGSPRKFSLLDLFALQFKTKVTSLMVYKNVLMTTKAPQFNDLHKNVLMTTKALILMLYKNVLMETSL